MKKILLALVILVSATQAHAASITSIASIDCLASNGVTIKSAPDADYASGHAVTTRWGFLRKDFSASLGETTSADTTVINLDSDKGTEYQVVLNASPFRTRAQKATGTILEPSASRGMPATLVAYVSCNIRLR